MLKDNELTVCGVWCVCVCVGGGGGGGGGGDQNIANYRLGGVGVSRKSSHHMKWYEFLTNLFRMDK